MEADGTESLLELVDQIRKKTNALSTTEPSKLKKQRNLENLAALAFSEGLIKKALDWLGEAINLLPSAQLYSKRSIVHLHLGHNVLAAADATCSIGTDPDYASGYLCAALSRIRLAEYEEGLQYLEKFRRCYPNSKKINSIYVSCRNMYWETGKIRPFDPPASISKDFVDEEYSALDEDKLTDLKVHLSSSGVLEASKLTEDFVRRVVETYKRGVFHLPQKYTTMILRNVLDVLKEHPNIVSIDISRKQTLTVVGDLRGQFSNLLSILRHNRSPHFGRPYLFNGNVIGADRMSMPTLIVILCLKILFPEDVFINRGSEECLEMCEINGFESEVLTVYDEDTMKGFSEVFNWLPVAHVLNNNVLIVHGGLFEDESVTLADVQGMKRAYQPPDSGPLCDIIHSDPWNYKGVSKKGRNRGVWFGPDVTERFCLHNCIDYIVRSHQNVGELGYEVQTYRQCLTVDSSTNYATYLVIRGKTSSFKSVHARKEKVLPKHCKCFLVCNCRSLEQPKQGDPLHDGYVTTNMTLPNFPSFLKDDSQCTSSSSLAPQSSTPALPKTRDIRQSSKPILVTSRTQSSKTSDVKVTFNQKSGASKSAVPDLVTEGGPSERSVGEWGSLSESITVSSAPPNAQPSKTNSTRSIDEMKSKSEELPEDQYTIQRNVSYSATSLPKTNSQISAGKKSPKSDEELAGREPDSKTLSGRSLHSGATSQNHITQDPLPTAKLVSKDQEENFEHGSKDKIQITTMDDDAPFVDTSLMLDEPSARTLRSYNELTSSASNSF